MSNLKKFYIVENDQQLGPFTVEELKSKQLTKSTLVWTEGMEEWSTANSIGELNDILNSLPPPLPEKTRTYLDCPPAETASQKYFTGSENFIGFIAGAVGVVVFSLFNWVNIPIGFGYNLKFNLFSILEKLNDRELNSLLSGSQDFNNLKTFMIALTVILLSSFVLLLFSLVKHQSKNRTTLAYWGFSLSALTAVIFIVSMLILKTEIGVDNSGLTVFPFLTIVTAIISVIFFVKQPMNVFPKNENTVERKVQNSSRNTKSIQLQSLTNKYLYLVPGGILLVMYLWGWFLNLKNLFNPNINFASDFYLTLFLNLLATSILILVLFCAYKSKRQTVWCVFALTLLNITRECWWIFVKRVEIEKQHGIEIPVHFLSYLGIVLLVMLFVVALWDIFDNYRNK